LEFIRQRDPEPRIKPCGKDRKSFKAVMNGKAVQRATEIKW